MFFNYSRLFRSKYRGLYVIWNMWNDHFAMWFCLYLQYVEYDSFFEINILHENQFLEVLDLNFTFFFISKHWSISCYSIYSILHVLYPIGFSCFPMLGVELTWPSQSLLDVLIPWWQGQAVYRTPIVYPVLPFVQLCHISLYMHRIIHVSQACLV